MNYYNHRFNSRIEKRLTGQIEVTLIEYAKSKIAL